MPKRTLRTVWSEVLTEAGIPLSEQIKYFEQTDVAAGERIAKGMIETEVTDEEYEPFKEHMKAMLREMMGGGLEFGLYDTVEDCWMGDAKGPVRYKDVRIGQVAERVINEQFGTIDRYMLRPILDQEFKHRDTVEAKMTSLEAIRKIEGHDDGS